MHPKCSLSLCARMLVVEPGIGRGKLFVVIFFFKLKTANEVLTGLVGSEISIRDRSYWFYVDSCWLNYG